MSKVCTIVVNYNGKRYLGDCLDSLFRQTYEPNEIILVDNGSTDDSVDYVKKCFPKTTVLVNSTNLGFAAANNKAILTTSSQYVATLNNDALASPDWLAELVKVMESDRRVGSCASKMLLSTSPDVIDSTGIRLDWAGIAWDRWGGIRDAEIEGEAPIEILGPCGGAALYKRAMLDEIGLFDEDFFLYLEDVDLAWRARLAGWKCLYVAGAKVYHAHSATAGEASPFKNWLLGRNKVWLVIKNYPVPHFCLLLPIIVLYDLMAVIYGLIARRESSSLRGRLAGLRDIAPMWRKRQTIQRTRKVPFKDLKLDPVESPFCVLQRYQHLNRVGYTKSALAGGV